MKVLLKKSTEDMNWGGDDYDIISLNPISKAMTDCYLPLWSPSSLKALLLKRLGTLKRMYLHLRVDCEKDSSVVKSISLKCGMLDDVERMYDDNKVDWGKIKGCLTEYFLSIGYKSLQCTDDEDIVNFIQRLEKDVPLAKEYFKVLYKCHENIARIGYFGDNDKYEMYVKTDDEETTPHFHIRDTETKGGKFETCVCLETNCYCLHGTYKDVLTPEHQAMLMDFMEGLSRHKQHTLSLVCNYEWAVDMWNLNNEATQVTLRYGSKNKVIIPDYGKMTL